MKKNRSIELVEKTTEKYKDDPKRLARELKRLVSEGQNTGDIILVGVACCRLAKTCYDMDNLEEILRYALRAVALLKDTDEYEWLARAYISLGYVYNYQENYLLALASDETAYEIVRKHRIGGDIKFSAINNLAVGYRVMGEIKKSIRLLNECIEMMRKDFDGDYMSLAMYSINLAEWYKEDGEPQTALDVLASMEEWIDKVEFTPLVCDYYLRRALHVYELGNFSEGSLNVDKALDLVPDNIFPHPVYDDLRQAAHFLSKNGDRPRAERILGIMTVYAEKNKGTIEQLFAARMMADFYSNFGEYERAAGYYAKYEELNERRLREIKEMQFGIHRASRNAEMEIRRLKQKMRKNEELISLEPMTKLLNRSAMLRISDEFISSAVKKKQKVGAIFIDIDCFKECNDTYGHAKGDEIIKEVADILKGEETKDVRFARYGGDEFLGITRGLDDEGVSEIARRICRSIRKKDFPNEKNPCGGRLTVSVGAANVSITDRTDTIIEVVNYADKAVYHAKNSGKNAIYMLKHSSDGGDSTGYVKIDF